MPLTPEQVAKLKGAGFSAGQIQQISAGTAATALMNNAKKHLGTDPQSKYKESQAKYDKGPGDQSPGSWGALGNAIMGGLNPSGWADFFGFGTSGQTRANSDFAGGRRSVAPATPAPAKPKNAGVGGLVGSGLAGVGKITSRPRTAAPTLVAEEEEVDPGLPSFPDLGAYTVPNIAPRDFTEEARRIASEAFAPIFASLEASKGNIGKQGEKSRQIVGGLYENMVKDIATQAAAQDVQYDQRGAEVGASGQALQEDIGQNYASANQGTADLLQKLGIQAAAPELLQAGSNDQAYQQSQAAQGTNAMQGYFDQQQQGQKDYNQAQGQITQNQGAVAQQDILAQVAQALQGVDQSIAGQKSEEMRTALDIGNTLTDRDFSAQQANAGFQMSGQDAQRQAALQAWQAAVESQRYDTERSDREEDQAWQRQLDQAGIDISTAQLEQTAKGSQAGGSVEYTGPLRARQNLEAQYGANGTKLYNMATNVLSKIPDKSDPAMMVNLKKALDEYLAGDPTINPDEALTAVLQVYREVYGT